MNAQISFIVRNLTPSLFVPLCFRCDGTVDCPLGSDEWNCAMYSDPSATPRLSDGCDFGSAKFCGFTQVLSDQLNWLRGGSTSSPDFPNPVVNQTSFGYIYISSRMNKAQAFASSRLLSPKLSTASGPRCLQLVFQLRSSTLTVYDKADSKRQLKIVFDTPNATDWMTRRMEVPASVHSFVIAGRLQAGDNSLIALQSVAVFEANCGMINDAYS